MRLLKSQRRSLQLKSLAPAMLRARGYQWRCYLRFFDNYSLQLIPCSSDQLSLYSTYMPKFLSYSSVCNYLQAVTLYHKLLGLEPPSASHPSVKMTLQGAKKLPQIHRERDPDHNLKVGDVSFPLGGLILSVRSSKTHDVNSKPHVIPISEVNDKNYCPVYWLKRVMKTYASIDDYVFTVNGNPLSYNSFQLALKKLLHLPDIKENITSHSFRMGGATFLSSIGIPIAKIKERGNWRSNAVFRYICEPIRKPEKISCFCYR